MKVSRSEAKERSSKMLKKSIAGLMAILMIAAVSTVSAFALTPGDYVPTLTATFPPGAPQHDLDFFDSPATVAADGVTVTIPLINPATVTVTYPNGTEVESTGHIDGVTVDPLSGYTVYLTDYDADNIAHTLVIVAPANTSISNFAPLITFAVQLDSGSHPSVPATVTLN
jgi:hypothetical protein